MAIEVESVPMPDPTDLDAVAGYAASVLDPGGSNPRLWIEIRRSLEVQVVDGRTALQKAKAQITIGRNLDPRR